MFFFFCFNNRVEIDVFMVHISIHVMYNIIFNYILIKDKFIRVSVDKTSLVENLRLIILAKEVSTW